LTDDFKHKGKRKILVEYLRQTLKIRDERLLEAVGKIPRHAFLESVFEDFAYEDRAFPIAAAQTISHPSTVAEQTELLQVNSGEKILEIGTGSGYQTCVLVEMGAKVFTIERQKELYLFSKKIFRKLGISPLFQSFGDGFEGLPEFAPYDKILVTCGAETLPAKLLKQLKIGGKMVIPLGKTDEQILTRLTKIAPEKFEKEQFGIYQFVPMLGKKSV
jgi:protein-L-isoaspartate(D-aspartate) O-methyltransferase